MLTAKKYARDEKLIIRFLYKFRGDARDSTDALHEFYQRRLEGKSKRQSIKQFVLDYLRRRGGRKGQLSYAARQSFERAFHSTNQEEFNFIQSGDFRIGMEDRLTTSGLINRIESPYDRVVARLMYVWGFDQSEIADLFDVTASRISQRTAQIESALQEIVSKGVSRGKQRKRKRTKPKSLLRALPKVRIIPEEKEKILAEISQNKRKGLETHLLGEKMAGFKVESFSVSSFS